MADTGIFGAQIAVNLTEERDLVLEGDFTKGIGLGVQISICADGRVCMGTAMSGTYGLHCFAGTLDRGLGKFGGMRVTRRFAGDRPQSETLRRVETGTANTTIVERDALGLAIFEIEFTVIGTGKCLSGQGLDPPAIKAAPREEQLIRFRQIGHAELSILCCPNKATGAFNRRMN